MVRRSNGAVTAIVEHGDATDEQRAITEVNTSAYAFDPDLLGSALVKLGDHNVQGERYLTDVIGVLVGEGHVVATAKATAAEGSGVNSHDQLATVSAELRRRINAGWMASGVFMEDPARVSIGAEVELSPDVRLWGDVHLAGRTTVASGAELGPSVHIADSTIAEEARVWFAAVRGASIGRRAEVGPFVSLREGTVLADASKAGTFVEIKASVVGPGSRCHTCRTWVTPPSGPTATWGREPSPPTTTGTASTAPSSATGSGSARTPSWWRRSRSATGHGPAPAR